MTITSAILADRLREAEAARDEALRAAQHWEGRSAELRQLATLLSQPEPEAQPESVGGRG
jgi:hypothetical protein